MKEKELKKNPESLDRTNTVRIKDEWIDDLRSKIDKDIRDRSSRDEKLLRWYKKRYGIRPAQKTSPWPGASNIHVFLTDEKIRKMKPNYINLAFEGDPVVTFQALGGTPLEVATNAELLMDWILKYRMNQAPGINYFRSLSLIVDRMLEKGKGFAKVIWDYQCMHTNTFVDVQKLPIEILQAVQDPLITDEELYSIVYQLTDLIPDIEEDVEQAKKMISQFRSGERILRYKSKTEIYNGPRVVPVDDKDLIVPEYCTDIQTATRITHRLYMTENDLKIAADNGKYNAKAVKKILDEAKVTGQKGGSVDKIMSIEELQTLKRQREGVQPADADSELFEVWEVYTYYDIDNDGVDEKVVITYHNSSKEILRMIEFPYNHYKWPFVVFDFELNDDRFYSQRGLPELLDHYQTELTVQENAKLDRMTLANSLQFKYRIGAINPKNIRFIPGQGIPVHRMDDLMELQISNIDLSFDSEMEKIRKHSEAYIGQPDLDAGELAGGAERRTAFEVSEMVSVGKQIFSFDARLFKDALHKLYDQIFELWIQYGPNKAEIQITGSSPLVVSKLDIIGNFNIVPSGEFTLLARTLEVQRAFAELQLALTDQSGAIDKYNAWDNYLRKSNPKNTQRLLRTREQYEQIQQMQQEAQMMNMQFELAKAGRGPSVSQPTTASPGGGNQTARGGI